MPKTYKAQRTLNEHRWADNPLEKRYVMAWRKQNEGFREPFMHLRYLLNQSGDQRFPDEVSDRDCQVAETVIQWLGSPVGQAFVKDVLKIK